jgi:hypothetical protein
LKPELWHPAPSNSPRLRRDEDAGGYARLLVSDIRLYHEEDVILGRRQGDLARRLGGAIERARELYRRRFQDEGPFDRELVAILAGGDPTRLG